MSAARTQVWLRDLGLGARFALSGREGWARTVLTAVGVGLGVALLLLATSVPHLLHQRNVRSAERDLTYYGAALDRPGDDTLLVGEVRSGWYGQDVTGELVRPEGAHVRVAPGLPAWPRDGEMYASPALLKLLADPRNTLLRERIPYRVAGAIGHAGLLGPGELYYYAGDGKLTAGQGGVYRTNSIGGHVGPTDLSILLTMLLTVGVVVVLLPIGILIGTAARVGGERRDRRLAALRLVGVDRPGVHRITAGESMVGAAGGVLLGFAFFLAGRQIASGIAVLRTDVYGSDLVPNAGLAALIVLAVPALALLGTQFALRGVAIEPLGVVRNAAPPRRRLWWRVLLPCAGLALLLPALHGLTERTNLTMVASGVALVLVGVTAVLPWLVERVVRLLGQGPLPVQLGSRRLQLSTGSAARAVSGITVAVAGTIALQTLFGTVLGDFRKGTGADLNQSQVSVVAAQGQTAAGLALGQRLAHAPGVRNALTFADHWGTLQGRGENDSGLPVTVADCTTLAHLARIADCSPGAVYYVPGGTQDPVPAVHPGDRVDLGSDGKGGLLWTVPAGMKQAAALTAPDGATRSGLLATPQALPFDRVDSGVDTLLDLDPATAATTLEQLRTMAAAADPLIQVMTLRDYTVDRKYTMIRRGVTIGAVLTMVLVGLSLLLTTLEQLRERRRLLSVLVAFGTRRSTLGLSVLWQSTVPIVLGLALAVAFGHLVGGVLGAITGAQLVYDWTGTLWLLAVGAGVVLATTLLSLPLLWRLMRPNGLPTE
ncbi:FtsX-like permease family protein [Streptacidiphilus monticola]|uniref:FtsX-like permease family protein n=1 Tax=Streptacidiphilus monticola TaxID=2161674 RepID=A0ABW1G893_9ACTN